MADFPPTYKYPLLKNEKSDKKMSIPPLIFPRSHDAIWGFPSGRHSNINNNNMAFDLSEEYGDIPQTDDYSEYDPRVSTYTNFALENLYDTCKSNQYSPKNGLYSPYGQYLPPASTNNSIPPQTTPLNQLARAPIKYYNQPTLAQQQSLQQQSQRQPIKERYQNPTGNVPVQFNQRTPVTELQNYDLQQQFESTQYPLVTYPQYSGQNQGLMQLPPTEINTQSIAGPTQDWFNSNNQPPADLLIPKTITSIYGQGAVSNEERIKYLENIQPDSYTFSQTAEPINANMGISYNPDIPPMVRDQVATPYGTYPLYNRIDPQLVRDQNISPERLAELPRRTDWSARYNTFDAAPGTVGFEDIYDPRYNGNADSWRSYGDVNLGQVQYYYSDLDAYRNPNFTDRSKVDFIDFIDPMGRVLPEYRRQVSSSAIADQVNQAWDSDSLYWRQDHMESIMRRKNQELWQNRAAPVLKTNNTHSFTSNY